MAVREAITHPPTEARKFEHTTGDYFRHWCEICDEFNEWQQKNIIAANASSQQLQEHRETLKWLLRTTKLLHLTASDPDFPDKSVGELLATKAWQLEQVWKLLFRPLSEEETQEAEMVLKEVFPNEPGT